jgi:hypothetical protein
VGDSWGLEPDPTLNAVPGPDEGGTGGGRRWLALLVAVAVLGGAVLILGRDRSGGDETTALAAKRGLGAGNGLATNASTTASTSAPSAMTSTSAATTTAPPTTAAPATTAPAPRPPAQATPKKGVSVWDAPNLGASLADVGAAWYYNWSAGPTGSAGGSAEFVPMIWGPDSVDADTLARAKSSGSVLLGFNEPDFGSQSNMSVEQALELWPQLQATGLRLGSPAVAVGAADPGGWLDRFLAGARDRGHRVDFIALHWYGGDFGDAAVVQLRGYIQAVHDRYHLPIWLTEYALIRFGDGGSTYPTDAEQAAFAAGSTAMLESLPFVERYAWFALPSPTEGGQGTALYHDDATPTPAGAAYRAAG